MVSVLSGLPTEQDSNPYQISHPTDTGSWTEILSYLRRSGWSSSSILWIYVQLFIIVYRTSRWPEAIPLQSTTAEECAKV